MLQSSWPTQPQVLKLGIMLSLLKCSQMKVSLNPTQGFNSNHSNLTKRGWGGLLKCSHGSEMALECNGISTHEWVRVWSINTPLSKTSRCSISVRPVGSNKLAVGPERSDRLARPVRPVTLDFLLPSVFL